MRIKTIILLVAFVLFASSGHSHPITFKNGFAVWTFSMKERQDFRLNYTFQPKWALGVNYSHFNLENQDNNHAAWLQLNHLLKRWNTKNSQANIYLSAGFGGLTNDQSTKPMGHVEAQADFETRRIYVAANHQSLFSDFSNHRTKLSAGIAPYLADYDGLHTWVITHVMIQPNMPKEFVVAPGLRFFYKQFFGEIGSSLQGDWFITAMFHF